MLIFAGFIFGQNTANLTINISNIQLDSSKIFIGLYDNEADFKLKSNAIDSIVLIPEKEITEVSLKNIPFGIYAVAIFQDLNNNGKLDSKEFKIPVCILSVDTPFVTLEVYEKLFTCKEDFDVVIAKSPFGSHQLCAIYSPTILPILKKQIENNNHKIRDMLKLTKTKYVDFEDDEIFTNLNKPEDYKKANIG